MPRARSPVSASTTETVLEPFRKSWPAMMLLVVLCGIGYGSYQLAKGVGANISQYVAVSGANLDALVRAQVEGTRAHASLQEALANVLGSSVSTRDAVIVNSEKLNQITKAINDSIELLKTNPVGQEVQMASLHRIEASLTELTRIAKESPRLPLPPAKPAP